MNSQEITIPDARSGEALRAHIYDGRLWRNVNTCNDMFTPNTGCTFLPCGVQYVRVDPDIAWVSTHSTLMMMKCLRTPLPATGDKARAQLARRAHPTTTHDKREVTTTYSQENVSLEAQSAFHKFCELPLVWRDVIFFVL